MRYFVTTIVLGLVMMLATACSANNTPKAPKAAKPTKQEKPASAHQISKAEERLVLKHAREDLEIIMGVQKDTKPLKKALTGHALKNYTYKIKTEAKAGKITVRKYADIKLEFHSYTKGVAGVSLNFTDKSYFADSSTGESLEPARNTPLALDLALKKTGGRWKITDTFGTKAGEKK